ncbi:MAG TPA: TIR domain-containing protein [Propionibacteriaceae bacterium]
MNESLLGRIFISYRRQETAWPAGRLYDVLVEHFPPEQVFKDVDNIDPSDDFVERLTAAVASCDVLLALIGPQWLTITNKKGQRRLDDPEDYVLLEIETALTRKIPVIPILVDEAQMPGADELPPTLVPLVRRNAVEINPLTFDTKRLIATVRNTLELEVVRRQQELASNYAQASAAADVGDWEQAVAKYSMVAEADPGYRDMNDRLAEARKQHQLATLQAEAQRLHRAGQWAAVIKVGEQLQAIDPAAADPDGLITSARAELAAAQRTAMLAADYHNGLRLFDAGWWEEAVAAFERVTRLDSTYRDVAALLGQARRELEKASVPPVEEQARRQAEEQARREEQAEPKIITAVDENVQFTVYRPNAVQPEVWYPLLAFAHLAERRPEAPPGQPDPLEQVRTLAAKALGHEAAYGAPQVDARGGVPRESELTFVPFVEGVDFNPRSQTFEWQEDVHQQNFRLKARAATVDRVLRGQLTVYLGAFILADVDLTFRVDVAAPPPPTPTVHPQPLPLPTTTEPNLTLMTAVPYQNVFASYSHKDLAIVHQAEAYGKALGHVYVRDRLALRSGEEWEQRLLELIDQADIFQLFWSSNSMKSEYVRREWEHALALGRRQFIRPTYWEVPMPQSANPLLPPAELAELHFHGFFEQWDNGRQAEEQAQRQAEEQARARQQKEAEDRARRLRKEQRRRDTQQLHRNLRQQAAHLLSRGWVVVLAVAIGGALLLSTYVVRAPPAEGTIMGELPADLRASCSAETDTSATCHLPDGTVVIYRLFDTAAEARADVVNGNELAPNGTPCPPSAAPAAGSSVICRYAVGAETGVAAFSHTVKPPQGFYAVRWVPDAHPRLRGVMSTENTTAQDWDSLQSNWMRLVGMP